MIPASPGGQGSPRLRKKLTPPSDDEIVMDRIKVCVRIRPVLKFESESSSDRESQVAWKWSGKEIIRSLIIIMSYFTVQGLHTNFLFGAIIFSYTAFFLYQTNILFKTNFSLLLKRTQLPRLQ